MAGTGLFAVDWPQRGLLRVNLERDANPLPIARGPTMIGRYMHGRLNPGSRQEAKLWRTLMSAWNGNQVAVPRDLAIEYTRSYPDNVWGWVVLADILASLALYDHAKAALRRAQALAPKSVFPEICVQWGHLYRQKGAEALATTWYGKAVKARQETTWLIFLGASFAK